MFSTSVEETGEKSFDIELQAGEYKFVCCTRTPVR